MIVASTELKNKLGKYLRDCSKGEIIITSNGRKIAKLVSFEEDFESKVKPNIKIKPDINKIKQDTEDLKVREKK